MSEGHETYRPRSPDLSDYRPQPPQLPIFNANSPYPARYEFPHRGSYDASPYFSPQSAHPPHSYFAQLPQTPQQGYSPQSFAPAQVQNYTPQQITPYAPTQTGAGHFVHNPPQFFPPGCGPNMPRRRKSEDLEDEDAYDPGSSSTQGGRSMKKRRGENLTPSSAGRTGPDPSLGIDVKTKFPVARIKRIMQADEDVGKVAQATPTAVSKALELFMITLVTKAATEAKDKGSKRVTAAHLKQAVLRDENLDFLVEIVSKVADPTEKKTKIKSDDSAEEAGVKKRSSGAASRRKRTDAEEEDF